MPQNHPYASVPGDNYHDNTSATATAGVGAALPATVQGYSIITINGQDYKVPYYKL